MITLAIVVMAVLPASVILFNDTAAAAGTEIAGLKGSGAETDPYLISSVNDLRTVSSSHSNHPGAYYKQTADIVFVNTITGSSVTITITKENNNIVIGIGTNAAVPANEDGTTTFAHVALNSSQSSSDWENGFKNVIFDVSALEKKNTVVVSGRINDKNFATAVSFSDIKEKISATAPFDGNFTPIGTKEKPFSGFYDGNGHSITGMKVVSSGVGESSAGMFAYTGNATIFNTNISSTAGNSSYFISTVTPKMTKTTQATITVDVYSLTSYSGSIIGNGTALSSIALCKNDAVVCSMSDFDNRKYTNGGNEKMEMTSSAGGLAGSGVGKIDSSSNTGSVMSLSNVIVKYNRTIFHTTANIDFSINSYAGGLIGQSSGASISRSWNSGNVRVTIDTYAAVAVAKEFGSLSGKFITESFIGGIAGSLTNGKISDVYNAGEPQYLSKYYGRHGYTLTNNTSPVHRNTTSVGGIAGILSGASTIVRAHSVGNISAKGERGIVKLGSAFDKFTEKIDTTTEVCDIGEMIGQAGSSVSVDSSYYLMRSQNYSVTGKGTQCSALKLNAPSMMNKNTFIGWDFNRVWTMSAEGYPVIWVRYDVTIIDDSKVFDGTPKYSVDREHSFDKSGVLHTYTDKNGFLLTPIGDYDKSVVSVYVEMSYGGKFILEKSGNNYKLPAICLRDASNGITLYIGGLKLNHFSVTDITGVPSAATAGVPLTLTGKVTPDKATNKNIVWSVKNPGTAGAAISGNTLTAPRSGVVTITATIADGKAVGSAYTKDFMITVQPIHVTNITGIPADAVAGAPLTLAGTVVPSAATNRNIVWSVTDPGTTGAVIDGNTLRTTNSGTVVVTATIADGKAVGSAYTQIFTITVRPVPVTDITGIPVNAVAGVPLTLTNTIVPSSATNKNIVWSVTDPGTTGATIDGNTLRTMKNGTVKIKATIVDGKDIKTDYTKEFTITVRPVPVTDITDVPLNMTAGTPLTLKGTIIPGDATNKNITWSVIDPGTTGASIEGNTLRTMKNGTVKIKATITDGKDIKTDYTKEFTIAVHTVPVTDITDVPQNATAGTTLILAGAVIPGDATNKNIIWSVIDPGTTGAVIDGNTLRTTKSGIVKIKAAIADGTDSEVAYEKEFAVHVHPVPVTDIIDVPRVATAGTPLMLYGTVVPDNATNQTIIWSVSDPGTTGAEIGGNELRTTNSGSVVITATIIDGTDIGTEYTQNFDITVQPVPSTEIIDLPSDATAGTPLILEGTVIPDDATNKDIVWSVSDPGTTGAEIDGNELRTTNSGSVVVTATIIDGPLVGTEYAQNFTITVHPVPVTEITDVPDGATVGIPLMLSGTVVPDDATNKEIVWSVLDPGTTGAVILDGILGTTGIGSATITATVIDGIDIGSEYTENFTVIIHPIPVTDITDVPDSATTMIPLILSGTVVPDNATKRDIKWVVTRAGTTGAAIDPFTNVLRTTGAGTVTVTAVIIDGTAFGTPYMQDFEITVRSVPVIGITDVPETVRAGEQTVLTGTVVPDDATYRSIEWSVLDPGTTGAVIDGNVLEAFGAGVIVITATITDADTDLEYAKNFTITVQPIPATDIIDVPKKVTAGVPLTLSGKVVPSSSTNKDIIWTVSDPGTTGAYIDDGHVMNTTAAGVVVITATIIDGAELGTDLFESFVITVDPAPVPAPPAGMMMKIVIGIIAAAMLIVTTLILTHTGSVLTKESKIKIKTERRYKS